MKLLGFRRTATEGTICARGFGLRFRHAQYVVG